MLAFIEKKSNVVYFVGKAKDVILVRVAATASAKSYDRFITLNKC